MLIFKPEVNPCLMLKVAVDRLLLILSITVFILSEGIFKLMKGNENIFKENLLIEDKPF